MGITASGAQQGYASFWSNRVPLRALRPGDHLYVWSSFAHHHHAIYVGPRKGVPSVIHVFGANKSASKVQMDSLRDFAKGRVIRRARYDRPWWELYLKAPGTVYAFEADPPNVVVERAERWLRADVAARQSNSSGDDALTPEVAILKRLVRESLISAAAEDKAVIALDDAPWHYNLIRRNCECFCVLCTAPTRQSGSHQAQQLSKYNPLATLVAGILARVDHYRNRDHSKGWFASLLQSPAIQKQRDRAQRFKRRLRIRLSALRRRTQRSRAQFLGRFRRTAPRS